MSSQHRPYKQQQRLKAAMKLRNLTASDVAAKAGLSAGYVRLLLNGFAYSPGALDAIGEIAGAKPERQDAPGR